jgi:hypothetical protein
VRCDSKDLFGERIQVEGLLGSQTDVILFLDMLDGRSYTTTLKPARAVFVVPEPASWFAISSAAFMAGLRGMLQHFEIVLLLLLLLFSGIGSRKLTIVLAVFILSHALGQYLAQQKWLLLTSYTPILIVLFVAVWAGFMLVKHRENTGAQLQPVWLLMAIVGLANGGANPEIVGIAGLSFAEQQLSFVQYQTGVLAGLLVYCLLSKYDRLHGKHPRLRSAFLSPQRSADFATDPATSTGRTLHLCYCAGYLDRQQQLAA